MDLPYARETDETNQDLFSPEEEALLNEQDALVWAILGFNTNLITDTPITEEIQAEAAEMLAEPVVGGRNLELQCFQIATRRLLSTDALSDEEATNKLQGLSELLSASGE